MILQFSSALCVQPSTETVKQLPSFQIVFGGKIEWFDHYNLKAMPPPAAVHVVFE